MNFTYTVIRSDRRSAEIQIKLDLSVTVRVPKRMQMREVERFVESNAEKIEKSLQRMEQRREKLPPEPTKEEEDELRARAKAYLPGRVEYYSKLMGVEPTGITITSARTRHGSCSAKNRISFSYRIMRYSEELIDYVVVHELAHIRHHDHSRAFYDFVARVMPDHKERRARMRNPE